MEYSHHRSHKLSRRSSGFIIVPIILVLLVVVAAVSFMLLKKVMPTKNVVESIETTKETTVDMRVVQLGQYPQNDISGKTKEPIDWIILETRENEALLLSEHILDCKSYNYEFKDITWEECDLRKWLNNDFYNTAFDVNEQNLILEKDIVNEDNKEYGTKGGNVTRDKVFCLSID